jgi:hypothetical protein
MGTADTDICSWPIFLPIPIYLPISISKLFNRYLADTDIADIYLANNRYADTNIQLADTDISLSAKYIGKPIYLFFHT